MNIAWLRRKVKMRRKTVLIRLIATAGLLIICYAAYSWASWSSFKANYRQYEENATKELRDLFGREVTRQYSASDKLKDIQERSLRIEEVVATQCNTPTATGWMVTFDGIEQNVAECKESLGRLRAEAEKLHDLSLRVQVENQLAGVIREAADDSKDSLSPDTWQAAHDTWAGTSRSVDELLDSQSSEVREQHGPIIEVIRKIEEAWNRVIEAHNTKSQAGFEDAKERLTQAYGDLENLDTQKSAD